MFAWHFSKTPLPQEKADAAIAAVKARVALSSPLMMIVFGSIADGNAHDGSDLDVLLVYETDQDVARARHLIYSGLTGPIAEMPVDLIFVTRDEYRRKRDLGGVCFEAAKRGLRIIDQCGD